MKIAIVAEYPSKGESMSSPFTSTSGRILRQTLLNLGVDPSSCYMTYVHKDRLPPKSKLYSDGKWKTPTPAYGIIMQEVIEEIKEKSPNITILLGDEVLRIFTSKTGISDWRGSILPSEAGKVIPTVDPQIIFRQYSFMPLFQFDIKRAIEESESPDINIPEPRLITDPTFCDIQRWIDTAYDQAEFLSFDIETINHHIDCIGFSWNKDEAICIPLCKPDGSPHWTSGDEQRIWSMMSELLTRPELKLIAQNATYDITYLRRYGVPVSTLWMDTMNAHHAVYPEFPKGLDFLTSIYTKFPYYKDKIGINRWEYNALDAVITYHVAMKIEEELLKFGTHDFYHGFVNKLIIPYMEVQNSGMSVDFKKKEDAIRELDKEIESLINKIEEITGYRLNPLSPKQLKEYFYETKGYQPYLNKKTGKPSCDDESLQRLKRKYGDPSIELIQEARSKAKLRGTLATDVDCDGRIRTSYIISGTETGRLASRQHVFGHGTNLQNIPRTGIAKEIFIAGDGNILIGADLSQAEARVVACLSDDPKLVELFSDPTRDVHSENAALIFGGRAEDYPGTEERQVAKKTTHAANYDISYKSYSLDLGIPEKEGKRILDTYHSLYPGIRQWHRATIEKLRKDRTLITPFGRKRYFFGRWGDNLFKEAFAYIPQSTVADLINTGFLSLYESIKEKYPGRAWIRLQVHDALYVECEESIQEEVGSLIVECMEIPLTIGKHTITIPTEYHVGKTWNDV